MQVSSGLCSKLPELGNLSVLEDFSLDRSSLLSFYGEIPASWGSQDLAWTNVGLYSDILNGSIPRIRLYNPSNWRSRVFLSFASPLLSGVLPFAYDAGNNATINIELNWKSFIDPCTNDSYGLGTSSYLYSNLPLLACNCTEKWPDMQKPSASDCSTPRLIDPTPADCTSRPPPILRFSDSLPIPPLPPYTGYNPPSDTRPPVSSDTSTFIIPRNTQVFVPGNATFPGSLVFDGTNSTLVVAGCVSLTGKGTPVEVTISQKDLEKILKSGGSVDHVLIQSLNGNNCPYSTNLANVKIGVKKSFSGCRRVKVRNSSKSTKAILVASFTVDNSICHIAIIIPVVFGAILIITVVATIVVLKIKKDHEKAEVAKLSN